jgi:hypothetical protein
MGAVGGGDARLEHAAGALDRSKASLMHPPEAPLNLWRNIIRGLTLKYVTVGIFTAAGAPS